jgi:hypothetical protein
MINTKESASYNLLIPHALLRQCCRPLTLLHMRVVLVLNLGDFFGVLIVLFLNFLRWAARGPQSTITTMLFRLLILAAVSSVQATNLLVPTATNGCTIDTIALLQIPGEPPLEGGDVEYECASESGSFAPLHLDEVQQKTVQGLAASGKVATFNQDGSVTTSGKPSISSISVEANDIPAGRRMTTKASKVAKASHFLLFRVTDAEGRVHPDSPDVMSDNVFGVAGDSDNIKTQLAACSAGKYRVTPGARPGFNISDLQSAPGVIDIKLDISLDNSRYTVREAALSKAREVMAHKFNFSDTTSLTTFADHTIFVLENCYQECGWAAYAKVGGYYQVRELTSY